MMEVRIIGESQVTARLGAVPAKTRERVLATMKRLQYALVNAAREAFVQAGLHSRTGGLFGSIQQGEVIEGDNEISAAVVAGGGEDFYARIHEYGGTIEAKNVANLTIPIGQALTAMGVARFSARALISSPGSYGYTGTFFKHGLLFGKKDGGEIDPLFILKPSVTIPSRAYMRPALARMRGEIVSELRAAVGEATS